MTFSFNETPYYEQVHQALYGTSCPRITESHGVDEDQNGSVVASKLILSLAGQDDLDEALARRVNNFSPDFMFGSQRLYGVEFGLNRAIQKGISLKVDDSDGMYYVYHSSGCIVKIPAREIKATVIPLPGLFDSLKEKFNQHCEHDYTESIVSAMWGEIRVFPTKYSLSSIPHATCFTLCKTEQPIYEGHDHDCWIKHSDLVY